MSHTFYFIKYFFQEMFLLNKLGSSGTGSVKFSLDKRARVVRFEINEDTIKTFVKFKYFKETEIIKDKTQQKNLLKPEMEKI